MNKRELRGLVCSMLLGDGFISSRDYNLGFGHSLKQRDYALWKAELLNSIFRDKNLPRRCKTSMLRHKVKGKIYPAIHVNLYWKDYFERLQRKIYKPKKTVKYLLDQVSEDIHLAIWFMDDGSEERRSTTRKDGSKYVCNPYLRLYTYGFTDGEQNLICQWFESRYHVSPRIVNTAKGAYLRWTVKDSEILFKKMKSYVTQIESMQQKFRLSIERY